ncbi:hypothetical protein BXZ70DRAFT_1061763 [Cristinia sonorae]|uniref:Uncharacterized protein n=1 Tax=Cristinia sonorae TaxID=1940300 RepID=A0A8K0XT40_9AGAR|nr:hypothetical protein BXZ70DRAFT_1061763 [Cristinia sonorae]
MMFTCSEDTYDICVYGALTSRRGHMAPLTGRRSLCGTIQPPSWSKETVMPAFPTGFCFPFRDQVCIVEVAISHKEAPMTVVRRIPPPQPKPNSRTLTSQTVAMSIPPEYEQTHKELEDAIQNPVDLTNEQKTDALNTISDEVSKPGAEQDLIHEIDALAGAALEVDGSFDNIMALFRKIKTSGARPDLIKDVDSLMSTWSKHHHTFTGLLWESREVAGKARGAADDFSKDFITFLGDDDVSIAEKKEEIVSYMNKLERDKESSQEMSQGFTDLEKDIQAFQVEWKRIIDKYKLDAISARIAELDEIIANLEVTLIDLNDKVHNLYLSAGAGRAREAGTNVQLSGKRTLDTSHLPSLLPPPRR